MATFIEVPAGESGERMWLCAENIVWVKEANRGAAAKGPPWIVLLASGDGLELTSAQGAALVKALGGRP